ncbi:type II toxin-antitoxin system prevent-host-death family antitoxin [Desulfolutivibrio sulfodismutans DSM 3696]|nr:type II toxin-antitoxin system prevent-host-death family antitoxin [Desulfolutivibrio sulfodismutans DSM 3696]
MEKVMIQTTATNLRRNLFSLLEKVGEGETVTVTKGGKIVARILPEQRPDWRAKMPPGPKLLVPADEAFSPMPDEWGDLA